MKKIILFLALGFLFFLSGCGSATQPTQADEPEPIPEVTQPQESDGSDLSIKCDGDETLMEWDNEEVYSDEYITITKKQFVDADIAGGVIVDIHNNSSEILTVQTISDLCSVNDKMTFGF